MHQLFITKFVSVRLKKKKFKQKRTEIEISINWCMESGHMKVHEHYYKWLKTILVLFAVIMMQRKRGVCMSASRSRLRLLRGSLPHERVSRTDCRTSTIHSLNSLHVIPCPGHGMPPPPRGGGGGVSEYCWYPCGSKKRQKRVSFLTLGFDNVFEKKGCFSV